MSNLKMTNGYDYLDPTATTLVNAGDVEFTNLVKLVNEKMLQVLDTVKSEIRSTDRTAPNGVFVLAKVQIDNDPLYRAYLNGFQGAMAQEFTCGACQKGIELASLVKLNPTNMTMTPLFIDMDLLERIAQVAPTFLKPIRNMYNTIMSNGLNIDLIQRPAKNEIKRLKDMCRSASYTHLFISKDIIDSYFELINLHCDHVTYTKWDTYSQFVDKCEFASDLLSVKPDVFEQSPIHHAQLVGLAGFSQRRNCYSQSVKQIFDVIAVSSASMRGMIEVNKDAFADVVEIWVKRKDDATALMDIAAYYNLPEYVDPQIQFPTEGVVYEQLQSLGSAINDILLKPIPTAEAVALSVYKLENITSADIAQHAKSISRSPAALTVAAVQKYLTGLIATGDLKGLAITPSVDGFDIVAVAPRYKKTTSENIESICVQCDNGSIRYTNGAAPGFASCEAILWFDEDEICAIASGSSEIAIPNICDIDETPELESYPELVEYIEQNIYINNILTDDTFAKSAKDIALIVSPQQGCMMLVVETNDAHLITVI